MNSLKTTDILITREMDRFVHLQSIADLKFVTIINSENKLQLQFTVKDKDLNNEYKFEVINELITNSKQIQNQTPILRLLSPIVECNLEIHILPHGLVCYTFPGDIKYNKGLTCGYTVEQSFKWAFGYEYYLKHHFWPFDSMPHGIYPILWGFSRPHIAA